MSVHQSGYPRPTEEFVNSRSLEGPEQKGASAFSGEQQLFINSRAMVKDAQESLQKVLSGKKSHQQSASTRIREVFWGGLGRIIADLSTFNVRKAASPVKAYLSNTEVSTARTFLAKEVAAKFDSGRTDFSFNSVYQERLSGKVSAGIYEKYLQALALDNPEMAAYMRAMDDFRSKPTLKKAEAMLREFFLPEQLDENGVALPGQSTNQLNLQSKEEHEKKIKEIKQGILEAHASRKSDKFGNLLAVFEQTERYLSMQIRANISRFTVLVAAEFSSLSKAQMVVVPFTPDLKA